MNLLDYLPSFYEENETMLELQNIFEYQIADLSDAKTKAVDNCFLVSANDLISRLEKIYGYKTDTSLTTKQRAELLMAFAQSASTVTKSMLETLIEAYENGKCTITENSSEYSFLITFDGSSVPTQSTIALINATVDSVKPSHLAHSHTFAYKWWGISPGLGTWGDERTWVNMRTY